MNIHGIETAGEVMKINRVNLGKYTNLGLEQAKNAKRQKHLNDRQGKFIKTRKNDQR